ncbi:MAG: hypothetical protein B6I20_09180 [Bacteroidetes bacterium 4572_117]|nr:MAG: hypothetical protein B6I20_09180 [Bacteroidetes bacterium 4572_117]
MGLIKKHILIVDDEPANLELLSIIFSSEKIHVTGVQNPELAVSKVKEVIPDLVLLDIDMPIINGFEICEALKKDSKIKNIPIIFVSAKNDKKDIVKGFSIGAVDYVIKPFNKEELQARVSIHLEHSKTKQALEEELEISKGIEKKLRESIEKNNDYEKVIDANMDIVFMIDMFGNQLYFNKQLEVLLGYKRKDLLGKSFTKFIPKEELTKYLGKLKEVFLKKRISPFETFNLHKDGRLIPVEIWGKLAKYNGKTVGIGTIRNISDRKKVRKALYESEKRYQYLIEKQGEGVGIVDLNEEFTFVNPAAEKLFGVSKGKLVGRNLKDFFDEKQFEIISEQTRKRSQNKSTNYELILTQDNGQTKHIFISATPEFDDSGKQVGTFAIFWDITERKNSQLALKESEEKYRLLTESMQDLVVSVSVSGRLLYVSQASVKFGGYIPEEEIGNHLSKYFQNKPELIRAFKLIKDIVLNHRSGYFSFLFKAKNKAPFPVELTYTPEIVNGKLKAIHMVMRDITERKKARVELRSSEKRYRGLFNGVPIGLYRTNLKGEILEANTTMVEMLGYPSQETLLKTSVDKLVVNFDNRQQELAILSSKNIINNYRLQLKCYNGDIISVLDSARSTHGINDETLFYEGSMVDVTDLEKAEQAQKDSEKKYENIIENLNDVYYRTNASGKITMASPSAAKTFGFSNKEEIIGLSLASWYKNPSKREEFLALLKINGKIKNFRTVLLKKDGTELFVEASSSILLDDYGNYIGVEGIVRDITEKRKVEEIIKKSEEKYRLLTETMKDVVVSISPKGEIIYISPAITEFAGYIPKKEKGNHISGYFAKKTDLLSAIKLIEDISYNHKSGLFEFLLEAKNKNNFPVEITYTPLIRNNKLTSIQIILRDISERKANELELEKHKHHLEELVTERTRQLEISRNKFKNIIDSSNDAIFITDLNGYYKEFNDVTIKRIGVPKNELFKLNLKDFHNKSGNKSITRYFNSVIKTGQKVFTTSYTSKSGKKIHIELNGTLIKHEDKKAILHFSRDITERQEAEIQKLKIIVQTEEKERKRFAKDIHDGLGATLSAAKMYLNIFKRAELGSERATDMLNQALWLVDNAGKTAKEIAVNIRPHDLAHFGLITSLQNFCERLNSVGNFNVQFNTNSIDIKLDENIEINLFRTINELINNTLKYADAKNIIIDLNKGDNKIVIKYSDDGKGFDYEKIMNSNKSGTGLDNIIHRAKLTGGRARIYSEQDKGMSAIIRVEI